MDLIRLSNIWYGRRKNETVFHFTLVRPFAERAICDLHGDTGGCFARTYGMVPLMKHIGIALRISLRGSNHLREVQMKRAEEGKITSTNDLICAALERVYGGSFKPPKAHNYKWKVLNSSINHGGS